MKDNKKRTEISELGEFGLIDELTSAFTIKNSSTVCGVGDDAAVINPSDSSENYTLISTDMLLEGINFDLTYFPLKHLGYKAVVVGCNDIYAMNGTPQQITINIGVSSKLSVEQLKEFYEGVQGGCDDCNVDLVGGDTTSSMTGFSISITAVGFVAKEKIAYRSGAKVNDLICITGNLGAAYMGLHLLERERRVLKGHPDPKPQFEGYEYLLRSQLKPSSEKSTIESLAAEGIVPTAMIDISDGLSSDLMQICKSSGCGARIYLERIPISNDVHRLCEEMNIDPVVAALNGGDDNKMLFTLPIELQEKAMRMAGVEVIGHITEVQSGIALVTPDGSDIELQAQGFTRVI